MSGLTIFLRRERLYILILILVTILSILAMSGPAERAGHKDRTIAAGASAGVSYKPINDRASVEKAFSENKHLALMFMIVTMLTLALFLLGIIIDIYLLVSIRAGRRVDIVTYAPGRARWTLWDVAKVVILYFFFAYMIVITESFLVKAFPAIKGNNFRMILNSSIMDTLVVVLVIYFTVSQYKDKLESLGLTLKNFIKNVYYGILAYIALIPVMIAIVAVTAVIINLTKYVPHVQPVVGLFLEEKNAKFLLYTSIFAAIAGPIIEEIFFRGFMYNAFKKYIGVFWAIIFTGAMFALLHAHMVGFMPILALGILLAYLYERTGSLVSSITVHMIHNISMVVLVFLVKQLGVYR